MDRPMVVQLPEVVRQNLDDLWFGAFGELYLFTCTDTCTETTRVYLLSDDAGKGRSCAREALGWDTSMEVELGVYRLEDGDFGVIEILQGPRLRLSRGQVDMYGIDFPPPARREPTPATGVEAVRYGT